MRKLYPNFLFVTFLILCTNVSFGQIVGTNTFLQGHWLEIGITQNGSFGACTSPAGYHPHTGTALAEVYDYGHDGWTVGTPAYMGDYTYPGSPFEGWEMQVGTGRTQAFQNCAGTMTSAGGGSLATTGNTYINAGGRVIGNWTGTAAGGTISVKQETRVDTNASWVVVTTRFYNLSATPTAAVYYMRSCDPDNNETWAGGSFTTDNYVDYQNDIDHRVQVRATTNTPANQYPLTLCTKDCRAVALIYNAWPLGSGQDLAALWSMTYGGGTYTTGGTHSPAADVGDIAIALVYNIGVIPANDSAVISYAYTFLVTNPGNAENGVEGIDSAFPEPTLMVNNLPIPASGPAPAPTIDTFNACLFPGLTTLPVSIMFGSDKCWTWSTWTWAPATGLATTTGVNNTISITGLPPTITYTITGTDASMCNTRTMYLTITTCNGAVINSPCLGDPLTFNAPGDSTGATYTWYGPAPSTTVVGTTQSFTISPSVWADTGTYHVVKTVLGVSDTSVAVAIIHPDPIITASSNSPLCAGAANTLTLTATPAAGSAPVTAYSWTGPASFTSAIQDPVIPGFVTADAGTYTVIATSVYGCKDTATTLVQLLPPPGPPTVVGHGPYCQGDAPLAITVTPSPGATVYWYPTAAGGAGSTTTPVVSTTVPGSFTYYYGQSIGACESPIDSVTIVVNPTPSAILGLSAVCQFLTISLTDATTGGAWTSSSPSIATVNTTGLVTGVLAGTATIGTTTITYKLPTGCFVTHNVTVNQKPAKPVVTPPTYCQFGTAAPLTATPATGLLWYGPGITPGTPVGPTPATGTAGVTNYYATETNSAGCVSDSAIDAVTITPLPAPPITRDTLYCQNSVTVPLNYQVDSAAGSNLNWYNAASGGVLLGAAPLPSSAVVTYPAGTTWYVTQTVNGCEGHSSPVKVTVVDLPSFTITASNNWVCDHDSLTFSYNGSVLVSGTYYWYLPPGATTINGTTVNDPTITVRFDSVYGPHILTLAATELNLCTTYDTISIRVVPPPTSHCYMKPDICLGDTVSLALSDRSDDASIFSWFIDGTPLMNSTEVNIVAANSNTGGPFSISWNDSGNHVVTVTCTTTEGCKSDPTYDTVHVHPLPDPVFNIAPKATGTLCLEDSILFSARHQDANCSYLWEPEHCFNNNNKPEIWGKVEQGRTDIWLTITDPFGCKASYNRELSPDACCTVLFPTAFTPNGDGLNDKFRPIFNGYHNFHQFRIVNRWGQTVFESANSNPEWDGSFNGVPQDMGVYYYFIKFDCGGNTIEQKGDCTLVR